MLRRLFGDEFDNPPISSFENVSEQLLQDHLGRSRYGAFTLTDAIRPAYDLQVIPTEGYKLTQYHDQEHGVRVPVLMAAVSRERLFEVFMGTLSLFRDEVDVVLETHHHVDSTEPDHHFDLYRSGIDLAVLSSTLYDFEDLLCNDGCTGIAVLDPRVPMELQFDDHKLLIVYAQCLTPFAEIFDSREIPRDDDLPVITDAEHVHGSSEEYFAEFEELRRRLGIDGPDGSLDDGPEDEDWLKA